MTIAIKNGMIITQNEGRGITKGNIVIEGNRIAGIYKAGTPVDTSDIVIDASSAIVMPGLVNTHAHIGMSIARGYVNASRLGTFLKQTAEFDSRNTKELIEASTLLGAAEMLRTGTTTFVDLYYSEDIIADVIRKLGIRAYLAWVVLDKEFTTQKGIPIENAERFVASHRPDGLVNPAFGLQGVYVCSAETIAKTLALAEKYDTIVHMHIAETKQEVKEHVKKYGKRPVEWLSDNNLISSRLIAAHAIWLNDKEIDALANNKVTVSYNITSNLRLRSGRAKIKKMLKKGVNITLGTDSTASNDNLDMLQLMKVAALETSLRPQGIIDFATVNAAKALNAEFGSIEEGRLADIVLLDRKHTFLAHADKRNLLNNIVYAAEGLDVVTSIVNGKVLIEGGKFIDIDYDNILDRVEKAVFDS